MYFSLGRGAQGDGYSNNNYYAMPKFVQGGLRASLYEPINLAGYRDEFCHLLIWDEIQKTKTKWRQIKLYGL